ncbi:pseudouridine synthase [Streptococcus moroccensis]|uniref:Pseudouridine synthase n=1 Tax=Streptococcus moroccensis TaxID=1451356 RepID=A0ABT9YP91_9STRE|nr:pseudouridine synthase [Streptococcus moroccensis]MDQ0221804.1 16S rRNA pseudouridine516 synthase [Streptococcus moroccensis]
MRLDKFIVAVGAGSRSQAKSMVKAKRLTVNGQVAKKSDMKIDPEKDSVCLDGQELVYTAFDYIMLNKPAGVISATEDARERTVLDLLPDRYQRVAPVGRLDKDTVGLLLLTNDGQLNHNLLSPKKHVDKCYEVTLEQPCPPEAIAAMKTGVTLDDGYQCLPAELTILSDYLVHLTIQEGKFHQVKRMFLALGNKVTHLKRLRMGSLTLDPSLEEGDFRLLTEEEVTRLQKNGN